MIDAGRSFSFGLAVVLLFCSACEGGNEHSKSGGGGGDFDAGGTTGKSVGGRFSTSHSSTPVPGGSSSGSGGGNSMTSTATPYVEPKEAIDLDAVPAEVPQVKIEVPSSELEKLEADPYDAQDVFGAFLQGSERFDPVDINFRGAYALQTLIRSGRSQRNWKVKFAKEHKYEGRREWNFNYETHVRQKLAYDLMRFAGVKVPSAAHVRLAVNGGGPSVYLQYEDPDNKDFLAEKFGDDSGDLFKAAYDVPNEPRYFATLEYLGDSDADYEMHYRKMTNNDDPAKATDFSSLRGFLKGLNQTSEIEFEQFLRRNFDTDKFIAYLVVANFMSHWDSYPQRPKNFWLYQIPAAKKWVFIPWDMDATFQTQKWTLNPMGTDASIFYQFDGFEEYAGRLPEEGTVRPLVTRMMRSQSFRSTYVARYREALGSYLDEAYLLTRVDKLAALIQGYVGTGERKDFDAALADTKSFIEQRTLSVRAELAALP
jgi:spore coat protein CotH